MDDTPEDLQKRITQLEKLVESLLGPRPTEAAAAAFAARVTEEKTPDETEALAQQVQLLRAQVTHTEQWVLDLDARRNLPAVFTEIVKATDPATGLSSWGTAPGSPDTFTRYSTSTSSETAGAAAEINGWKYLNTDSTMIFVETLAMDHLVYRCVVTIPPPPEYDGNYVLGWDGTKKRLTWVATATRSCPPSLPSESG